MSSSIAANKRRLSVLISGAGFGGLAAAWWMNQLGYAVSVVEVATSLRKGGTPVNIKGGVIDVVKRMGLLERIVSQRLPKRQSEMVNASGDVIAANQGPWDIENGELEAEADYEIERDVLLDMLFTEVKDDAEFLFGDSVLSLSEFRDEVIVDFKGGNQRSFDLILGCDGTHSAIRKLCFGKESAFIYFLQNYFSLTIVDKLLIDENSEQMYNTPGKTVIMSAYKGKTDIAFCFHSEKELVYDRCNLEEQKVMVRQHLEGEGWRVPELLDEMTGCEDFYFDKLCQVRMKSWTKGRVALVGDSAYCPSPAAGMGGSMAILGAAALADAFQKYPEDREKAFQEYEESFRPVATEIQTQVVEVGLEMFMPSTEEALQRRNAMLNAS